MIRTRPMPVRNLPAIASPRVERVQDSSVSVFLCGDVMTGRGVDQILPHPGHPRLYEAHIKDARAYVELAERMNGPIPRPVDFAWPWGDALDVIDAAAPDVRVLNLETSITRSDDVDPGKSVCYRMNPANVPCLTAARPDVSGLANNHVRDFGERGLMETLETLRDANLRSVGATPATNSADRPAVGEADFGRVLVFAYGTTSAGVPASWAASDRSAGINVLPDVSAATAHRVADRIRHAKRPGDVAVVSLHWGTNWGYDVTSEQIAFAHGLIVGGVDLVYGHSSHHPRPIEVYHGKLILYGCGDLINDYEGIRGAEAYRGDLRLLYFADLDTTTGELGVLRMVPMQSYRMRLRHASSKDVDFLWRILSRISAPFNTRIDPKPDGTLELRMG